MYNTPTLTYLESYTDRNRLPMYTIQGSVLLSLSSHVSTYIQQEHA